MEDQGLSELMEPASQGIDPAETTCPGAGVGSRRLVKDGQIHLKEGRSSAAAALSLCRLRCFPFPTASLLFSSLSLSKFVSISSKHLS